jgi:hypothetical protein
MITDATCGVAATPSNSSSIHHWGGALNMTSITTRPCGITNTNPG